MYRIDCFFFSRMTLSQSGFHVTCSAPRRRRGVWRNWLDSFDWERAARATGRGRGRDSRPTGPRSIPRRARRAAPISALRGRRENGPPAEKNTIILRYKTCLRKRVLNVYLEKGHYVTHVLRKKALTRAGKNTFKSNCARRKVVVDRFFNGFCSGPAVVCRWLWEKCVSEKNWTTTSVGFELRTSVMDKPLSYSVIPDWNLKPGPPLFVNIG